MMILLLFYATVALAKDVLPAKFALGTVYENEGAWFGLDFGGEFLNSMHISCVRYGDPIPLHSPWQSTIVPHVIEITNCSLSTTPLAEVFKKMDFDITHTKKLRLESVSLPPSIPDNYTAGLLYTTEVELSNVPNLPINFFTTLKSVNQITVENMELAELKLSAPLTRLSVRNAAVKNMTNCQMIQLLNMKNMKEDQIYKWPPKCGGLLRNIYLESMSPATVQLVGRIKPYLFVESFTIQNCSLVELPLLFMRGLSGDGTHVFSVRLPKNNLEDKAFLQFPNMSTLVNLDISYNRLKGECLRKILPNVGLGSTNAYIQSLHLEGNEFTDIFEDHEIKTYLANLSQLSELYLNWMHLEHDCLRHIHFNNLKFLGLTANSSKLIENLQLHRLPSTGTSYLTVDLRGRPVKSVNVGPNFNDSFDKLNGSDHWLTNKGYKLTVLIDFVDCDCKNDILHRALMEYPEHINIPALRCNSKDGELFLNEPMKNLNCRKATVNGCTRKLSRETNYTTEVDCSYLRDKFRWPRPRGFRGLNAAGNDITSLRNAYFPDSLEWLDLRFNNIFNLTAEDVSLLFGSKKRRLWLGGNPIFCTCENRLLLETIQAHHAQIVDYSELQCFQNKPVPLLKNAFVFELCKSGYSDDDLPDFEPKTKQDVEKKIFCSNTYLDEQKPFATRTVLNTLSLHECKISRVPLVDVLESLNINIPNLRTLKLIHVDIPQYLHNHYSFGLEIRNLELVNIQNFPSNFFANLTGLRRLTVEDMAVPTLPTYERMLLFEMSLKNSTVSKWDNCVHIQNLKMVDMHKENIPETWPHDCGGLRILSLEKMTPEAVQHVIMTTNGTSLRELFINHCALEESPLNLMHNLDRLNDLDLSYNKFEDQSFFQFPDLRNLRTLNLSHNKLKGEFLIKVLPKIPQLRSLILDGNKFVHIFQNVSIKNAIINLQSLERLSLNNMTFNADCLMYSLFWKLKFLGLQANEEQKVLLKLHGLPKTRGTQLTVDLRGRSFRSVQIDSEFYDEFDKQNILDLWITKKGYNLIVKLDYVDCVCNNDVLATALRDFSRFLYMPDLRCDNKDGVPFIDEPIENLNCLKATVHGCRRRISRDYKYITTVDCSYNKEKFHWPRPDKVYQSLNASGNNITSLEKAYIPNTLKWLDLRNNKISYLNGEQSSLLFSTEKRRVWLFGNPIFCECANRFLLNSLRVNHSQIMDYDDLTCANNGQLVRLVSVDELCRFKHEYVWGTCIALAVLALFAAIILRHYWISLRIYLYARGYCLSCLHEEDVDEDRPFDAFLSFAHGDDQYVMEQLLPQLEGEPNYYRICVHYRDWGVGEWIPAQIMQSVRLSKRTIIVLSKNFVTSLWGAMEFRYALAAMESEGRSRLLVLVLDDVLSENLAPELRNYLNLNTYLRCDDPWFWGKLRFAMPHTQRSPESEDASYHASASSADVLPMVEIQPSNNHSDLVNRTVIDDDDDDGVRTHEFRTV